MTEKTLEDIQGYEYDWLAYDNNNHVAFFTTGGEGYAPKAFLKEIDAYDKAIEDILKLAKTTNCNKFPKVGEECVNTWKEMSKRGIYAYDTNYDNGGYELVSTPKIPILVQELPLEIATIIKKVSLNSITFKNKLQISQSDITENE